MIKYVIYALIAYLIIGFALYFNQRRLTFRRSKKPNSPEYYNLTNVSEEFIVITNKIRLLSWLSKPKNNKPTIIFFHGNSFDIGERAHKIKFFIEKGYGILLHAYRGFSGNKGDPTEKSIYNDAKVVVDWVKKNILINENNIILYGESLGTAVAIELGQYKKYKGIILEAPFTSVSELAQKMYPIYPVKYLIWDKFDNISKINNLISPLLVLHGKNDEIVPFSMGKKIYEEYKNKKDYVFIDEGMHNNLYDYGIVNKVIEFINKH